jgi:hypothetical protein
MVDDHLGSEATVRKTLIHFILILSSILVASLNVWCGAQTQAILPETVKAVWSLDRAYKETTATRERVCVNGLWRWQPGEGEEIPGDGWGYFKVPGAWPGITDYLEKDSQTVYPHPSWRGRSLREVSAAWYQREISVPAGWEGRRIFLSVDTLNSFATVFVDNDKVGELRFPSGEIDITRFCRAGEKHLLTMHVVAMPLKAVMLSYTDSAHAREVKGAVARRGLCGDVFLVSRPATAIADVRTETSYRKGEISFTTALRNLASDARYKLRARIREGAKDVAEFSSPEFTSGELVENGFTFRSWWKPDHLWDLNMPGNQFELHLSLLGSDGKVIDEYFPTRFGYRELWIEGRDFYLNGSRLFVCALPIDNAQIGASQSNYAAARETMRRLKKLGINLVYTHNYDCTPGVHLAFDEILRAADDIGMLVSVTQPHFSAYDWQGPDADAINGYARDAAHYAAVAGNHPSVVFYSTSHNATGYEQDMNPDLIDGRVDPREQWGMRNEKIALRAEGIIHRLDPTRIVYHHAGGNIGAMYTINFYPNFAPMQELDDWFGHWAKEGTKPLFLCEYGAPFTWDWTMYRGWYQGKREWGSAAVPWEFCMAEWNSQFFGDRAFAISEQEKANVRWEDKQYAGHRVWHRWDYPTQVGSPKFEMRNEIMGEYIADNFRAYRTWGVSGISPWEYEMFFVPRAGVDRKRKDLPTDWDNLQRPGISPDYIDSRFEQIDTAWEYEDWIPTAAGKALLRNNQPVLAYIGGPEGEFTAKDHNYFPGETVEKQLVVINNSRETIGFVGSWKLSLPTPQTGVTRSGHHMGTGEQWRDPMRFELPKDLPAGSYTLRAAASFEDGSSQSDEFTINVLAPVSKPSIKSPAALFDPKGETAALLKQLDVPFKAVEGTYQPGPDQILILGKFSITESKVVPDLSSVRDGLRVIVFEQSSEVLRDRLGFRVSEYGLRRTFPRIANHPILRGISEKNLHDWRGEATTTQARLGAEVRSRLGPVVDWNGVELPHIWRCGNRGNVASVLIEKPTRGNFRPVLDGGFSLQYSPLIEYREGRGMVVFCQVDVTSRTEGDAAAETIARNLIQYVDQWHADRARTPVFWGSKATKAHLDSLGLPLHAFADKLDPANQLVILAPTTGEDLKPHAESISRYIEQGGQVLALGFDRPAAEAVSLRVTFDAREHISSSFAATPSDSPFAGISPADVFSRSPRVIPLVGAGATPLGDGVLGSDRQIVYFQMLPWQFDYQDQYNLKRTFRRASFALARLLGNEGVQLPTPLLGRFHSPPDAKEHRYLEGLYLDTPQEWDDPYRFFRW